MSGFSRFVYRFRHTQVHTGLLRVESGEHTGLSAFFYRKELSVCGFSLENADMQLFLAQNDPVFVKYDVLDS